MAGAARSRRRRAAAHDEGHSGDERWLLSYADMITLLMALFMVLFSISSVNTSKFEDLQRSLTDAFSGAVMPGGQGLTQAGGESEAVKSQPQAPIPAIAAAAPAAEAAQDAADPGAAGTEERQLQELKRRIDRYAQAHGLEDQVETAVDRRGLVVRLVTDQVLFASGDATLSPSPLLQRVAALLREEGRHDVRVEGHTDGEPVRGGPYPTNWELSTARASSVVRYLIGGGVAGRRLEASGFGELRPIASNGDPAGRARNRRVEIVLPRTGDAGAGTTGGAR